MRAGETNGLTDVPGLRVGHATLRGEGALTGTTVVLVPAGGAVQVVPIVPAAVVFGLLRGGDFGARPDASTGVDAYDDARGPGGAGPVRQGVVGAGTGAVAGGLKGGVGSASAVLSGGGTVAA